MKINVLMAGDKMCIAWFKKKIKKFVLSTDAQPPEGGTVTGAGTYNEGTVVEVEAIPNPDYEFDHWEGDIINKWSGLTGFTGWYDHINTYADIWLANGFTEGRDLRDYMDTGGVEASKAAVIAATAKGIKCIWGVCAGSTTITATTWPAFRQAILDAAQWAQNNGVYEFQLGNEEEDHTDNTTITREELTNNLRNVATEVKQIFTRGNISYSVSPSGIENGFWISGGKGDLDYLAANIYQDHDGPDEYTRNYWKTRITDLVNAFGVDGVYLTEFSLSASALNDYSSDEAVQATALTEMIEYIKASGIKRALFYTFKDDAFGVKKEDGTYRELWKSLINSN